MGLNKKVFSAAVRNALSRTTVRGAQADRTSLQHLLNVIAICEAEGFPVTKAALARGDNIVPHAREEYRDYLSKYQENSTLERPDRSTVHRHVSVLRKKQFIDSGTPLKIGSALRTAFEAALSSYTDAPASAPSGKSHGPLIRLEIALHKETATQPELFRKTGPTWIDIEQVVVDHEGILTSREPPFILRQEKDAGRILGILGNRASGKTTRLRLLGVRHTKDGGITYLAGSGDIKLFGVPRALEQLDEILVEHPSKSILLLLEDLHLISDEEKSLLFERLDHQLGRHPNLGVVFSVRIGSLVDFMPWSDWIQKVHSKHWQLIVPDDSFPHIVDGVLERFAQRSKVPIDALQQHRPRLLEIAKDDCWMLFYALRSLDLRSGPSEEKVYSHVKNELEDLERTVAGKTGLLGASSCILALAPFTKFELRAEASAFDLEGSVLQFRPEVVWELVNRGEISSIEGTFSLPHPALAEIYIETAMRYPHLLGGLPKKLQRNGHAGRPENFEVEMLAALRGAPLPGAVAKEDAKAFAVYVAQFSLMQQKVLVPTLPRDGGMESTLIRHLVQPKGARCVAPLLAVLSAKGHGSTDDVAYRWGATIALLDAHRVAQGGTPKRRMSGDPTLRIPETEAQRIYHEAALALAILAEKHILSYPDSHDRVQGLVKEWVYSRTRMADPTTLVREVLESADPISRYGQHVSQTDGSLSALALLGGAALGNCAADFPALEELGQTIAVLQKFQLEKPRASGASLFGVNVGSAAVLKLIPISERMQLAPILQGEARSRGRGDPFWRIEEDGRVIELVDRAVEECRGKATSLTSCFPEGSPRLILRSLVQHNWRPET